MATVTQTIVPRPLVKSFKLAYSEPLRFRSSEPMGILTFAQTGTSVGAIGAGDNKELFIRTDLPRGFLYRFKDFLFQISEISDSAATWLEGDIRVPYDVAEANSMTSILSYPVTRSIVNNLEPGLATYSFGGFADGANVGFVPLVAPSFLINGRGQGDAENPTFGIKNATADVGAWTCNFLFRYDFFPIEQGDNSGLYWSTPVTEI